MPCRHLLCLTLALLAAGCATPGREHYDPAYLAREAKTALASGDRGTAVILLARAVTLAPQDPGLRRALEAVRAGRDAVDLPMPATPVPPAAQPAAPAFPPAASAAASAAASPAVSPAVSPAASPAVAPMPPPDPAVTLWPRK